MRAGRLTATNAGASRPARGGAAPPPPLTHPPAAAFPCSPPPRSVGADHALSGERGGLSVRVSLCRCRSASPGPGRSCPLSCASALCPLHPRLSRAAALCRSVESQAGSARLPIMPPWRNNPLISPPDPHLADDSPWRKPATVQSEKKARQKARQRVRQRVRQKGR